MTTFTTYLRAESTNSIEQEFAKVGRTADKYLSTVEDRAKAATRALAGLRGGGGRGGLTPPVNRAFTSGLEQAEDRTKRLQSAQARLARENSGLVRGLRTTGQTLQIVQGPLGPIAGRVNAAADAITRLTGVSLGLAGAGAAFFAYTRAASSVQDLRSQLLPLYDTQDQANDAFERTVEIAKSAKAPLESIVSLYSRIAQNAEGLGQSQADVARFTELAAKAATLSGGSQQSRDAGLSQLAQGVGSGVLAGDELKSVRENLPALSKALVEGLNELEEFDGVNVVIGDLRKLGEEGKITSDILVRAIIAAGDQIEERFEKIGPRLSTSMTALKTNATLFVDEFEQATGTVNTLASGVLLLANNLRPVSAIAGGVAAAFLAIKGAAAIGDATKRAEAYVETLKKQRAANLASVESANCQRHLGLRR